MKFYSSIRYALVTIIALLLGACSGSGSELGAKIGDRAAPTSDDGSAEPLTVTITSPATGDTMETPDESVILEGTASSDVAIASVSWTTDKGAQGEASGSEAWTTGSVPLAVGENTVTVTAKDSAGATATETVTITRESGEPGAITLSLEPPTQRTDGTALTDLAGFRIHYGKMSETYDYEVDVDNPGTLMYVVENLTSGTWYFVATAYDANGLESDMSNEVSIAIP